MSQPISVRGEFGRPVETWFARQSPYPDLFAQILTRLDYEGTACFNYKIANGQPMIFEINPRFGGSLTQDVTAYADAYIAALCPD
jgi:predicted ATP-grasp superfamily ATP-dependent carboligase